MTVAEHLGSAQLQAAVALNLGAAYINIGDDRAALHHLQRSLRLARANELHLIEILTLFRLADLQVRIGHWTVAEAPLREAEQLARAVDYTGGLVAIYCVWAEVHLASERWPEALLYAEQSVNLAREQGETLDEGIGLRILGQALLASGQQRRALDAFEQSLTLLQERDPYEAARTKVQLGLALQAGMDTAQGRRVLHEAQATFQRLGAKRDLNRLGSILGVRAT